MSSEPSPNIKAAIALGIDLKMVGGQLKEVGEAHYYEAWGQVISLLALVGLASLCYLLARWGAKGTMDEDDTAESPSDR